MASLGRITLSAPQSPQTNPDAESFFTGGNPAEITISSLSSYSISISAEKNADSGDSVRHSRKVRRNFSPLFFKAGRSSLNLHSTMDLSPTPEYPSFETPLERYYQRLYCPKQNLYVHRHCNGLLVLGLAPGHPCRANAAKRQVSIQFDDQLISTSVSGKRKHGSQLAVAGKTRICFITCEDGSIEEIVSPIKGSVIEINRRVEQSPHLLTELPDSDGWLAILMPKKSDLTQLQKETDYCAAIGIENTKSVLR